MDEFLSWNNNHRLATIVSVLFGTLALIHTQFLVNSNPYAFNLSAALGLFSYLYDFFKHSTILYVVAMISIGYFIGWGMQSQWRRNRSSLILFLIPIALNSCCYLLTIIMIPD